MKKVFCTIIVFGLLVAILCTCAGATEIGDTLISRSVVTLDNGDYIVSELYQPLIETRSTKSGSRVSTYYGADDVKIWAVTVTGTFTYSYGVSSTATSSTATVDIFNPRAEFKSKNAYTSGDRAYAFASVMFDLSLASRTVYVGCDKYGQLY